MHIKLTPKQITDEHKSMDFVIDDCCCAEINKAMHGLAQSERLAREDLTKTLHHVDTQRPNAHTDHGNTKHVP